MLLPNKFRPTYSQWNNLTSCYQTSSARIGLSTTQSWSKTRNNTETMPNTPLITKDSMNRAYPCSSFKPLGLRISPVQIWMDEKGIQTICLIRLQELIDRALYACMVTSTWSIEEPGLVLLQTAFISHRLLSYMDLLGPCHNDLVYY